MFQGDATIAVVVAGFTALWALGIISVSMPIAAYSVTVDIGIALKPWDEADDWGPNRGTMAGRRPNG